MSLPGESSSEGERYIDMRRLPPPLRSALRDMAESLPGIAPAWGTPPEAETPVVVRLESPVFGRTADQTTQREELIRLILAALDDPARQLDQELRVILRRYVDLAEDRIGYLSEVGSPNE